MDVDAGPNKKPCRTVINWYCFCKELHPSENVQTALLSWALTACDRKGIELQPWVESLPMHIERS